MSGASVQATNLKKAPSGFSVDMFGGSHDVVRSRASNFDHCARHHQASVLQRVQTPAQHFYSRYMLPNTGIDSSKFLMSPMPGALISLAVEEGDDIEVGQELAVVEAMKMQNVLRAVANGKVPAEACSRPRHVQKTDLGLFACTQTIRSRLFWHPREIPLRPTNLSLLSIEFEFVHSIPKFCTSRSRAHCQFYGRRPIAPLLLNTRRAA